MQVPCSVLSKYRYRYLEGEVDEHVRQQVYKLCNQKDMVEVLELNVQKDHIHIMLSIPPKYSVSNLMGFLKGSLSTGLFKRFESLVNAFGDVIYGPEDIV